MLYRITLKVTFPDTVYSLGPVDKRLVHLSSGVPKSSSDAGNKDAVVLSQNNKASCLQMWRRTLIRVN